MAQITPQTLFIITDLPLESPLRAALKAIIQAGCSGDLQERGDNHYTLKIETPANNVFNIDYKDGVWKFEANYDGLPQGMTYCFLIEVLNFSRLFEVILACDARLVAR